MLDTVGAALALGVAGLDPTGALLAVAALTLGVRGRGLVAAALVSLVAVVALGTVLSTTAGRSLHELRWGSLLPGWAGASLGLVAGTVLLAWAVRRMRQPASPDADAAPVRRSGALALVALVGLTVASAAVDPAFLALALVSGRTDALPDVVVAQVVYVVVSQAPLVLLAGAVVADRHGRAVAVFQRAWDRVRPALRRVVTAALALAGTALVADSVGWFVTGRFVLG